MSVLIALPRRPAFSALLLLSTAMLFAAGPPAYAVVFSTPENRARATVNAADPAFAGVLADESLGAAVRAFISGVGYAPAAKAALLRAVTAARDALPAARGGYGDEAAEQCYHALLMYDIAPSGASLEPAEAAVVRDTLRAVLRRYLDEGIVVWDSDQWALGAAALRITAAYALFAADFPDDADAGRFRSHALNHIGRVIEGGFDAAGAWIPDSRGYTEAALEFLFVTARALTAAGEHDFLAEARVAAAFIAPVRTLPPQQCPLVTGATRVAGHGAPGDHRPGSAAILAAADIRRTNYVAATALSWYWTQCGKPATPLAVLCADTGITPLAPDPSDGYTGRGTVVARYDAGRVGESMLAVSFGAARGIPDLDRLDYASRGDISLIWRGVPLLMPGPGVADPAGEALVDRHPWRRNLVLRAGAGETPLVPDRTRDFTPERPAPGPADASSTADLYTDGLLQYLDSDLLMYASGLAEPVAGPGGDPHVRHVLYCKPDAVLVWDQVAVPYPLEWNAWIPGARIITDGNTILAGTAYGVNLRMLFGGDRTVQATQDPLPRHIEAVWPLAMVSPQGAGEIVVVTEDIAGQTGPANAPFPADLLADLAGAVNDSRPVGIYGASALLAKLIGPAVPMETLPPVPPQDLARFRALVIGGSLDAIRQQYLIEYGYRLRAYLESGGRIIILEGDNGLRLSGNDPGERFFDTALVADGRPYRPEGSVTVALSGDRRWTRPISAETWAGWLAGFAGAGLPQPGITLASAWSDRWQVLAGSPFAVPLSPEPGPMPDRIRVSHPTGRGFLTLLLPGRGESSLVDVRTLTENAVLFADPTTKWDIRTGGADWTDANLSVLIETGDGRARFAFDCTVMSVGTADIRTNAPVSLFYDERNHTCRIAAARNVSVHLPGSELRLSAGEVTVQNPFGNLTPASITRDTFITTVRVIGAVGEPIPWARVYADDTFAGATGDRGELPVRWSGTPPILRIEHGGRQLMVRCAPGDVTVPIQADSVPADSTRQ